LSHIAVDLKVMEVHAPAAARAAGVNEDRVLAGCVRTWHRCWSTKSDQVTRLDLAGLFGGADLDTLITALEVAFLEPNKTGWRVRGAARYLRINAAQSAAGKANAGNLKRGNSPGSHPAPLPAHPGRIPGSLTEHRAPSTEHREEDLPLSREAAQAAVLEADVAKVLARAVKDAKKNKPPKETKPPDPRHAPLVAKLTETFARVIGTAYGFAKQDPRAVSDLISKGTDEEILKAWERALRGSYPTVREIHELARHWNHFTTDKPQVVSLFVKPNRGPIDPTTQNHAPAGADIAF